MQGGWLFKWYNILCKGIFRCYLCVLDVAGFILGVGALADLASAVPGIGDTIALAKKTGKV